MNENMVSKLELTVKWLRILLYFHVTSIVLSLISFLPIYDGWTTWVSWAITGGVIVSMLQLAPVHVRYRKAAIFRTFMLCCSLITAFLFQSTVITLAAYIFSLLAVYQEYSAHSDLAAGLDLKLSRNWHTLFNWTILTAVLIGFGSVVAALILMLSETGAAATVAIVAVLLNVLQLLIDIFYLIFLSRTIRVFVTAEGEFHDQV